MKKINFNSLVTSDLNKDKEYWTEPTIEIIENEPIAHVIKNNKDFILDENGNYLPFSKRILNYYSIPKLYFKEVTNNLEIVHSSIEKDFGLKYLVKRPVF